MLLIKKKKPALKSNPRLALIDLRTTGPWMVKSNGEESFMLKKKKPHAILRPETGSGGEGGGLFLKAQVTFRA